MRAQLKSEFRKLVTIRSTYGLLLLMLFFLGLTSFYGAGYRTPQIELNNLFLAGSVVQHSNIISLFAAIISLLIMAHEYRHNTIIYSLVASNSRSKVLLSKIIVVMVFVLGVVVLGDIYGWLMMKAGVAAAGHSLPHQTINFLDYFRKSLYFSEGFALAGLLLAILIRNMPGAIVSLLVIPGPIEGLLGAILKQNAVYLPFTALSQVIQPPVISGVLAAHRLRDTATGYLSAPKGALVFLAYLIGGWVVAWYLFLHRDAQ